MRKQGEKSSCTNGQRISAAKNGKGGKGRAIYGKIFRRCSAFLDFYAQARVRKIAADAAHEPRGEQEEKTASYSISAACRKDSLLDFRFCFTNLFRTFVDTYSSCFRQFIFPLAEE